MTSTGVERAAVDPGQGVAAAQVVADAGEDLVVVEQLVELGQLGLELQAELRDQGEEVDRLVAVAEHGECLPEADEGLISEPSHSLPNEPEDRNFAPQTSWTVTV